MRLCRIAVDGRPRSGRVDGDVIHLLDGPPLDGGARATGETVPLASATLLPPVIPGVFYAVGLNYTRHAEHALATGYATAVPERPEVGYRANNALIGHGAPIVKPREVTGRFEAEGELVAVIGRTLRRASPAEARESVLGWTIGNDVSARAWQHEDRTLWRSKNSDTFKPMGPWIETDADPLAATTTVRVNGETRAAFPTGAMIFDPWEYIAETTRWITMHPGDVLWMGADTACAIGPGDVVEIAIGGIGVLSNPVRAESGPPPERKSR